MNYLYWFNKILKKAFSGDKLSEKHRNNRRGFNMFKLIAFDLDGTLLDDRKQIPEENLRALRYAAEKGVHLVPATGRLLCAIPEQLAALPFIRYHILINGAKVVTINSESTEIEDIKKTIADCGLEGVENINYLQAIKRVIGMSDKPLANE